MKVFVRWIIYAFVFVLPLVLGAQVEFVAKVSKKKLGLNERLRIDFEMNEDGDNFEPPDFEGFRVLGGPNQSISNSWINGKRSYSKTYSFFLAPLRKGPITIGQAAIEIDGERYKSVSVDVIVTEAVEIPKDGNNADYLASENVHLVAEVSKTNPYLNEAITVVYKLYVSNQVSITSNWREIDSPKYADFWSQTLDQKGQLQIYEGQYRGEDYRYVILRTTVLYPQKTGELSIEPLTLDVPIDVRSNRRDFFGRFMTTRVNKTISAGRRTIDVKPLPLENRPEDFTGAVGYFDFDTSISRSELDAQESLEYSVTVRGEGNLKLFELPKPQFPNAFEVYEPARNDKISTRTDGMRGSVSEVYTLVPQNQGTYPLASLSFSYFDPNLERYITKNAEDHVVNVINGPELAAAQGNTTGQSVAPVTVDADRFRYIKLESEWLAKNPIPWFGTWAYWRWIIAFLMLIPLWFTVRAIRERYLGDTAARALRQRKRLIAQYLSEAKAQQNNPSAFYAALERSLHLFLKAQLKLETSGLSKENISALMAQRQVAAEAIERLIGLIERCERARYAPSTAVDVQNDYSEAQEVISMINTAKR
ncbi:MAG TPA: BatD protein [Flavobacteriaceae bacterium]|nr:BatD protein [Flavobacteriaceae bacterium]